MKRKEKTYQPLIEIRIPKYIRGLIKKYRKLERLLQGENNTRKDYFAMMNFMEDLLIVKEELAEWFYKKVSKEIK